MVTRIGSDPFPSDDDDQPSNHTRATHSGSDDAGDYDEDDRPPIDIADLATVLLVPPEALGRVSFWLDAWIGQHQRAAADLESLIEGEQRRIGQLAEVATRMRAALLHVASIAAPLRTQQDAARLQALQRALDELGADLAAVSLSLGDHVRQRQDHLGAVAALERERRSAHDEPDDPDGMVGMPSPTPR